MTSKWTVLVTNEFKKDFKNLPSEELKKLVLDRIEELSRNPYLGVKLYGLPYFRDRVGDYRLIYKIDCKNKIVILVFIQHRKHVYKKLHRS